MKHIDMIYTQKSRSLPPKGLAVSKKLVIARKNKPILARSQVEKKRVMESCDKIETPAYCSRIAPPENKINIPKPFLYSDSKYLKRCHMPPLNSVRMVSHTNVISVFVACTCSLKIVQHRYHFFQHPHKNGIEISCSFRSIHLKKHRIFILLPKQ